MLLQTCRQNLFTKIESNMGVVQATCGETFMDMIIENIDFKTNSRIER